MFNKRKFSIWLVSVLAGILFIVALERYGDHRPADGRPVREVESESGRVPRAPDGECVAVTKVIDGDTIDCSIDGDSVRVRLFGIDAPERGQGYGSKATQFVRQALEGNCVTLDVTGTDQYGRKIAWVWVEEDVSLNESIVRHGYAWWYRRYAGKNGRLRRAERLAREELLGVWAQDSPIAPWEYRRSR